MLQETSKVSTHYKCTLSSSYWLATVLVYSAELEEAHVDQTGCRPLSLLLYFLVHHTAPGAALPLLFLFLCTQCEFFLLVSKQSGVLDGK